MTTEISGHAALSMTMQVYAMLQAEEVMSMVRLHNFGWGAKRIRAGGVVGNRQPVRRTAFDGLDDSLRERFSATTAMPMSFGRNWRASMGSRLVFARWNCVCSAGAGN